EKARKLHGKVSFVVDDILHTKLHKTFDYIFDRGCFHVLEPEERNPYIQNVKKLLSDKGILFLKCFSTKEINDKGPHRFSHEDIKKIFSRDFIIESIKDTLYQGRSSMSPKALFCVLKKK
ncbi:MAG: class I SAM-dependent methyltransferase, partial [Candidatus Portnoybacteria bacterium CG10_big_fil_rev_8_21_14_0_10_36_7]